MELLSLGVNSYSTCPYGWKLRYLDHVPQVDSAFAEWGLLCHSLYEGYAKGELAAYELGEKYEKEYPQYMHDDFPSFRGKDSNEEYYRRGQDIFYYFDGFNPDWEIIGAEIEVNLEIGGRKFVGYIDLLVRSKSSGRLIVVDHKSKSNFKSKKEQEHYALQLYLYSEWVYEHYGEYPEKLVFNMFRVDDTVEINFDKNDLERAKEWFTKTIDTIYQDCDFWDKITEANFDGKKADGSSDFFCCYLCGSRQSCRQSQDFVN